MRLPQVWRRARAAPHDRGSTPPPFVGVYSAGVTGAFVVLLGLMSLSPWLRVERVVWTGPVRLAEERYLRFEAASLGNPLLLLSEPQLRATLAGETKDLRIRLRRHLPATLEVRLEPRQARVQVADGLALDARGRVVESPALAGLPRLRGFAIQANGKALEAGAARLYRELRPLLEQPSLVPESIELRDDEVLLVLAETGSQVRMDAARAAQQIQKLRVFERSLGEDRFPETIDLRFQDQVVVRAKGGRRGIGRR